MNAIINRIESPTPAKVLRLMIQGLEEAEALAGFRINMSTFGAVDLIQDICFGCAATCTVMKIGNLQFGIDDIDWKITRHTALKKKFSLTPEELDDFETTIDLARCGDVKPLFHLCGMPEYWREEYNSRFHLTTHGWKEEAPLVEKLAAEIERDFQLLNLPNLNETQCQDPQ